MNANSNEKNQIKGGCFCGAVKFTLTLPSKWCAHCHCSMCRRVHGAGYVTWVGFDRDNFDLEDSENQLRWFESSAGARRGFCKIDEALTVFKG
jgi:hypothetical protein